MSATNTRHDEHPLAIVRPPSPAKLALLVLRGAARFTTRCPLRRTDPCVDEWGILLPTTTASDHPPLSPPSPRTPSTLRRFRDGATLRARPDRPFRAPREKSSDSTIQGDFHRSFLRRADALTRSHSLRTRVMTRFCHRGSPSERRFARRGLPLWAEPPFALPRRAPPGEGLRQIRTRARRGGRRRQSTSATRHDAWSRPAEKLPHLARLFD